MSEAEAAARSVTFTLSDPPSVNDARQPGRGRASRRLVSTPAYRAWLKSAMWEVATKCRVKFIGPVRLEIASPRRRRLDVDNLTKATMDALQKAGVYANDRQVDDLRVYRADVDETTITIESMEVAA